MGTYYNMKCLYMLLNLLGKQKTEFEAFNSFPVYDNVLHGI